MNIQHIFQKIKNNFQRKMIGGFSLIEAMIGIFIISAVIGGPMVIAGRAAQDIRYSKEIFSTTFLGEEAIEMIRFKRDTIFLECATNGGPASPSCQFNSLAAYSTTLGMNEYANEAAWRIFKTQFGYPNVKCFSVNGCTFDVPSMLTGVTYNPPTLYDTISVNCNTLYQDRSSQTSGLPSSSALDFTYLCGVNKTANAIDTQIKRTIKMSATTTAASCPSYECDYADDIKVDVTLQYNFRGAQKSITVTDFIKPRS